jgi:hypothetical protein
VNPRVEELKQAVEKACKCKAQHACSTAVVEEFESETVWDGIVETFVLQEHPKTEQCYAFYFIENGAPSIKTVLSVPPINSEEDAVRAAIAAQACSK